MTDDSREQFSKIYDQYIEKIYRFVYLKVDSQETAQDLTSRVFLKGWEAYQRSQNIKNPRAFLYKIARNIVIDYYRQKDKKKTVPIDVVLPIADSRNSVYDKAVLDADIESIKLSIQKLKKEYQDVIIWYYLEDMSAEQIAEVLDKSAGTVRVLIHRALESLKKEVGV
jgi:RNA polymerase sigma-70 factor (ECF subfamily)